MRYLNIILISLVFSYFAPSVLVFIALLGTIIGSLVFAVLSTFGLETKNIGILCGICSTGIYYIYVQDYISFILTSPMGRIFYDILSILWLILVFGEN